MTDRSRGFSRSTGITTLLNVPAVNRALNNVLATVVNLANSTSLAVSGVLAGK